MVVLLPCSLSHGFKETALGMTLFHFVHLFLPLWCIARGGVLHIQMSARDKSQRTRDGGIMHSGRW